MRIIRTVALAAPDFLETIFRGSANPLLKGKERDRLAAAQARWPAGQWPTLYQDIPADIRRPVIWDGRLLGGAPVTELAWRHFSPEVLISAVETSGRAAKRASLTVFAILIAYTAWRLWSFSSWATYPVWAAEIGAYTPILSWYVLRTLLLFAGAVNEALYSLFIALILFPAFWAFGFWRALTRWWGVASDPLRTPTRDALLVWKAKAEIRPTEYAAYVRQVERAIELDAEHMPVLSVGAATGTLWARGDMESPTTGQAVAFDGESIRQHVLCLGATGTGKTRDFLRPFVARIVSDDWGPGHRIGAYITDGKGTLHESLARTFAGRSDVVTLGTGPGHKGVDLLAGMTPLEVATTFKAVSGQVAGKPSDDFWPESASMLLMHVASVALAIDGVEEIRQQWNSLRPYSLLGLARLAGDEEVMRDSCRQVFDQPGIRDAVPGSILAQAAESAGWLAGTWAPMAQETKSGIVGNVNVVLGKLGGAPALAERFFRGTYADVVDVDHALNGGVVMVAVGETEWGLAGKVVTTWLKTRLYVAARRRLVKDPEACGRNSCAVVADEFQMLVTSGPDSDTTFWNIARETGLFLIAATQSIAALHQVLGHDQTANLVNLLRSKIVLKTEETSTLDYIRKIAGDLPRGWEPDPYFFSTQGARMLAHPDRRPSPPQARTGDVWLPTIPRFSTASMRDPISLDPRFIMNRVKGQEASAISSEQSAYWRQEDKSKEALTSGLTWRPKVEQDELLLGSGFAFAIIQRAGCDRADIIDLKSAA